MTYFVVWHNSEPCEEWHENLLPSLTKNNLYSIVIVIIHEFKFVSLDNSVYIIIEWMSKNWLPFIHNIDNFLWISILEKIYNILVVNLKYFFLVTSVIEFFGHDGIMT